MHVRTCMHAHACGAGCMYMHVVQNVGSSPIHIGYRLADMGGQKTCMCMCAGYSGLACQI